MKKWKTLDGGVQNSDKTSFSNLTYHLNLKKTDESEDYTPAWFTIQF